MPVNARIPLIGAVSAFGASGIVLALMGVGAPFVLAAVAASGCVGLILSAAMPRDKPAASDQTVVIHAQVAAIEMQAAGLRHDLRGALSPALIISDRLLESSDPAARRAGEVVIRSIERAAALLVASKTAVDRPGELAPPSKKDAA